MVARCRSRSASVGLSQDLSSSVPPRIEAQDSTPVGELSKMARGKDNLSPGFQAALACCRQLGVVLAAARLDSITRRAHTLAQLLKDGISGRRIRPGLMA
jgi:hypothetical protein